MATNRHPKKAIQEAIDYALAHGWRLLKAGPRAHIFGTLLCTEASREGCRIGVYSTPRSPENHAAYIRRRVDGCPHAIQED